MDERDIITLAAGLPKVGGEVVIGIGDDAAVVRPAHGLEVLAIDTLVEGTHFRRDWASAADVGWKAMAVNISDLAAMGARPRHALLSLTLPQDLPETWVPEFLVGLAEASQQWEMPIIGGDTVRGPAVVVTVTVTGETARPLTRSGVQAGWLLAVTGDLGGAAAGLHALQTDAGNADAAKARWRRPPARLAAGLALTASGLPMAVTDCSDGLVVSVGLLTARLGVELEADAVPIDLAALEVAAGDRAVALDWALVGGEDYELVLAMPAESESAIRKAIAPLPLTVVGRVTPGPDRLLIRGGRSDPLPAHWGFRHF